MKTIIAGSRKHTWWKTVYEAVEQSGFDITEVVSGGAAVVDALGEQWAHTHSVPCRVFHADWTRYGRSAGPVRNQQMADYADALIAVWDGKSRGTADMIRRAELRGLKVFVQITEAGE